MSETGVLSAGVAAFALFLGERFGVLDIIINTIMEVLS